MQHGVRQTSVQMHMSWDIPTHTTTPGQSGPESNDNERGTLSSTQLQNWGLIISLVSYSEHPFMWLGALALCRECSWHSLSPVNRVLGPSAVRCIGARYNFIWLFILKKGSYPVDPKPFCVNLLWVLPHQQCVTQPDERRNRKLKYMELLSY